MVDSFIDRGVSFIIEKGAIPDTQGQREIYRYGLELSVYYIIHAILLLAIGALFGRMMEVALLLFLFGLVQSNGGGYHANTHGKCMTFMTAGTLVFIAMLPIFQTYILLQLAAITFGLAAVIYLAPVAHKNHPLSRDQSKILGLRAKWLACMISLLWLVLVVLGMGASIRETISISMLYSGISIIFAQMAYSRSNKDDSL